MPAPTLFALSSGRPPAAISVIRISGAAAFEAARRLTGKALPPPRTARLRTLRDLASGEALDKALLLLFPGPDSATGDDIAELHLHGGVAVVAAVLKALDGIEGLSAAGPGDFTRRAFHNGVLDLPQVEGLADLLAAETEMQRRQAMAHADGHLTRMAEAWREGLLDALAQVEAGLDFADEGDVGESDESCANDAIAALEAELVQVLAAPSGERLRDGVRLAVTGPPNAGKSSLVNKLTERDVAIVTAIPGTTRDRIEAHLAIRGVPFVAIDTAGLRETGEGVEREGIARARAAVATADIVLAMAGEDGRFEPVETQAPVIRVMSRSDLSGEPAGPDSDGIHHLSAVTGDGLAALADRLVEEAGRLVGHGEILSMAKDRTSTSLNSSH